MIDTSVFDRHEKIALGFSGGKDSLACVYLLRPLKDRITIYHMDTGDLLPEVRDIVDHVRGFWPKFVHIQGNVHGWIEQNGMPTDLLPHTAHLLGKGMGESERALVQRYDCCFQNLMWPVYSRIKADGNTLIIRGTKACDMKTLPTKSGEVKDDMELFLPINDWSNEQVFAYLRSVGAPINRIYDYVTNSPECALCSAWWGERRAAYLKKFHPELHRQYAARLRVVAEEIAGQLNNLSRELADCGGAL